jgi:hypothetical protein
MEKWGERGIEEKLKRGTIFNIPLSLASCFH